MATPIWTRILTKFCSITLAVASLHGTVHGQQVNAPSNLIARSSVPGDIAISLFWTDNSLDEDGFEVQRCVGDDYANFLTIAVTNLSNLDSFNDTGLAEFTRYSYRVRALSAVGDSEFSNVATAATSYLRPNQVTDLQGDYLAGVVGLTWKDMANNETRYEIERWEVGNGYAATIIAVLAPDATSYVDSTALAGTIYSYRVRPWRFDVFGGVQDPVTIATGNGIAAPSKLQAKPKSKTSIELTWKSPSSNTSQIHVQRWDDNTATWLPLGSVQAKKGKFTDSGLTAKTTYTYRIRVATLIAVSPWIETVATTK